MEPGSVIKLKSLKAVIQDGGGYLEYKAPKGKGFKVIMLGVDSLVDADEQWKAEESLHSIGWIMVDKMLEWHEAEVKRIEALTGDERMVEDRAADVHREAIKRIKQELGI